MTAVPLTQQAPARTAWTLVLDKTPADPRRVVAGLPLALRLALDAQAGGAAGVVAADATTRSTLNDARLRIPVWDRVPGSGRLVRIPASFVVHRTLFKALAEQDEKNANAPRERDLKRERIEHPAPFGFDPMDVNDDETARAAEQALFHALRKPQDGWTSRHLNRYISLAVSRLLVRTPLRPNQISLGILAIGIAGALLATRGTYPSLLFGAFLFQTQSVLDGCDGEMSRVTHRGSKLGEWLDTIGDDITNYGFFAGAAFGLWRTTESQVYLAAGVVTVVCGLIASGLEYRYLIRIGSGDLLKYPLSQGSSSGRFAALQPLFKRDTFVFLTLVAAVFGAVGPMLCVFALGAVGVLIGVIKTELRLARERRSAETVAGKPR